MSRALVQAAFLPATVVGENSGVKPRMPIKPFSIGGRRTASLQSFAGLRCSNPLDMFGRSGRDFRSAVADSILVFGGKARRGVVVAVFERFSDKAMKSVHLAQEEARRLGHSIVGTEQLLLGLIGEGTGIAAKVLKSMGVHLKDARVEVERIAGRGSGYIAGEIPFTPRAKRVLELSLEEARRLGNLFHSFSLVEIC